MLKVKDKRLIFTEKYTEQIGRKSHIIKQKSPNRYENYRT